MSIQIPLMLRWKNCPLRVSSLLPLRERYVTALSGDEPLMLDSTDGQETLAQTRDIFR